MALTAEQIAQRIKRHQRQVHDVFIAGTGRDILEEWENTFVKGRLYHEKDRDTVYAIAQRDFVLEIINSVKGEV